MLALVRGETVSYSSVVRHRSRRFPRMTGEMCNCQGLKKFPRVCQSNWREKNIPEQIVRSNIRIIILYPLLKLSCYQSSQLIFLIIGILKLFILL